jgi:hypothetical protein
VSYPPHQYLAPGQSFYGPEAEAARQAQEAASTLGSDYVSQRLQEEATRGAQAQQERAAHLQAEAAAFREQQAHHAWAASAPAASTPPATSPSVARSSSVEFVHVSAPWSVGAKPAPTTRAPSRSRPEERSGARGAAIVLAILAVIGLVIALTTPASHLSEGVKLLIGLAVFIGGPAAIVLGIFGGASRR